VSSDVYFYEVGGGFGDQKGLGILNIDKYMKIFGFSVPVTGVWSGPSGTIPTPEWKEKNFKGDPWRVGDTYNTAIGQYGFQVTPAQVVRAYAMIANGGHLVTPVILKEEITSVKDISINIPKEDFDVVREGMRRSALTGTAKALNMAGVTFGGKTGTAQLGTRKEYVNSWIVGFFPFDKPRYAFAVIMEKGSQTNLVGASSVMSQFMQWMVVNKPQYVKSL
jgi:penicillin-binding protein 2